MKKWIMGILLAAVVLYEGLPFAPGDIATLQPIEAVRISRQSSWLIQTDAGDLGQGDTLQDAFADLQAHCQGEAFLDTADYLIVAENALPLPEDVYAYLRPSCAICRECGQPDLEMAAVFLSAHKSEMTLGDYRAGDTEMPVLTWKEGRMSIGSG